MIGDLNTASLENNVCSYKQLLEIVSSTSIEVVRYNKGRQLNYIWVTESMYDSVVQDKISKYTRDLDMPSNHILGCILRLIGLV